MKLFVNYFCVLQDVVLVIYQQRKHMINVRMMVFIILCRPLSVHPMN